MSLWQAILRRKTLDNAELEESKLSRVLTLLDLTALGVGSTLGLGVYIIAGEVAVKLAGPSVIVSFAVAAIASAFVALCYAEFATRVPKSGSAYIYTYVTIGEFVAFQIGWDLLLELIIGTASVARGFSAYIDALFDHKMSSALINSMSINTTFLGEYPDFFSFAIVIVLAAILSSGVKESSFLNILFTSVNLLTIVTVMIAGGIASDPANWSIPKEQIPDGVKGGEGGFFPFGFPGVMAGAAKCFYAFVGFDGIATTGEEAKNPQRNIPLAIIFTLMIVLFAYFGTAIVLTMMWPYYLQDPNAPFPHVFQQIGYVTIKWIVSIGAIFALSCSLLGVLFPIPRVLYAMSHDGLLFQSFKYIHPKTKTPILATMLAGTFAAFMALIFDLDHLVDMMSIGTLITYTIVAVCVLVLRYSSDDATNNYNMTWHQISKQLLNIHFNKRATNLSSLIVKIGIAAFILLSILLSALLTYAEVSSVATIAIIVIICGLMLVTMVIISRQTEKDESLTFRTPLVPILPCFSVFVNIFLLAQLDSNTWIRYGIWSIIGYAIYFTYGIKNSKERIAKEVLTSSNLKISRNEESVNGVNSTITHVVTKTDSV